MKHACFVVLAAAVALLVAAPAHATHVQCGDTIIVNTRLDSNVVCATYTETALTIGANNVTLHLGGHTINGDPGQADIGVGGGSASARLSGVTVRGGTIAGFRVTGVQLQANDSFARGLTITRGTGILFTGDGNEAIKNVIDVTSTEGDIGGIHFVGNDAYATRNTIRGGQGITVERSSPAFSNNPRIVVNTVDGCGFTGIAVSGYTNSALVARNTVTGCNVGISANPASSSPGGAQVRRNVASGNSSTGIGVGNDPAAFVWCNTTNDNRSGNGLSGTGISIAAGGTVQQNTANNNIQFGINAPGATDGHGNAATGNGTNCTPNIVCGPPPSTCSVSAGAG